MNHFWVVCACSVAFFATTLWCLLIPIGRHDWAIPTALTRDVFRRMALRWHIPVSHGVLIGYVGRERRYTVTPSTSHIFWDWPLSTRWETAVRPLVGDHIHMDASIWVNGRPRVHAEHDRDPVEYEPYEHKSGACTVPGDVAYTKLWPHAGVHTHCDGLVHVHPWSAPRVLRKEGFDVTLGLWFDQVGVRYWENSMQLADGERLYNNETHKWRVAEWTCHNSGPPTRVYEEHLDRIWLGYAYGAYVIWYGDESVPTPIPGRLSALRQVGAHGFDGKPYPHECTL